MRPYSFLFFFETKRNILLARTKKDGKADHKSRGLNPNMRDRKNTSTPSMHLLNSEAFTNLCFSNKSKLDPLIKGDGMGWDGIRTF